MLQIEAFDEKDLEALEAALAEDLAEEIVTTVRQAQQAHMDKLN